MNKEAITALVGWSIACLLALSLFIVGCFWLFGEPDNIDGGITSQESTAAWDNNQGSSTDGRDSKEEKYLDRLSKTELQALRGTYNGCPKDAKNITNASGALRSATQKQYQQTADKDDFLKKKIKNLLLLNTVYYHKASRIEKQQEVLKNFPDLKNCKSCSGELMISCPKCNGANVQQTSGRSRSLVTEPARCSECKNVGKVNCPDCQVAFKKAMQDITGEIETYCEKKQKSIEDALERRKTND